MLTGLLIFFILLLALLAIPVALTFRVSWPQDLESSVKLKWAFGLVRLQIVPSRSSKSASKVDKAEKTIRRPGRASENGKKVFAVVRQERIRQRVIRFAGDLWRAIRKRNISLCVRIGLGDPADTGQLWAVLGPVAGILANVREASIRIEPDFFDTTVELSGSGSIRIIPLRVVYLAFALLLSPAAWRAIRQMRGM